MRAALYARVSTEEQAGEEKESLGTQLADMRAYSERRGYEPLEPYVDVQSGADLHKQRPAFQRMLADIDVGLVDVVIVWRHDRAFRNLRPMVDLRDALDKANINIEGVTMPIDRHTLGLMAWVAELERESIRERVKIGKHGMARRGLFPCGIPPFGFYHDKETGHLAVEPEEAATVRLIYELYVDEGLSMRAIARKLNEEGVPTRGARVSSPDGIRKGWQAPQIARILKSPTYKGEWQYAKNQVGRDGRRRPNPEEAIITVPVTPIVSAETWELATKKAKRNKHHARGHKQSLFYLLRGMLYCDECGRPFRTAGTPAGRRKRASNGKYYATRAEYRTYSCRGQEEHPQVYDCRRPKKVRAEKIEGPVWEIITQTLRDPELLRDAADARLGQLQEAGKHSAALIAKRKRQISEAANERDGAVSLAAKGTITSEDLSARLTALAADMAMWQEELARLVEAADWRDHAAEVARLLEEFCGDIGPTLDEMPPEERQELLLTVVDKVWLDGQGSIRIEGAIPAFQVYTAPVPAVQGGECPEIESCPTTTQW